MCTLLFARPIAQAPVRLTYFRVLACFFSVNPLPRLSACPLSAGGPAGLAQTHHCWIRHHSAFPLLFVCLFVCLLFVNELYLVQRSPDGLWMEIICFSKMKRYGLFLFRLLLCVDILPCEFLFHYFWILSEVRKMSKVKLKAVLFSI